MAAAARWLLLLVVAAAVVAAASAGTPVAVGTSSTSITSWEFEQDPQDVGVRERWFSLQAKPTLARNITTPGTWQAMGVGKLGPGGFVGVGWYRQQLVVPPLPPGSSLWLWIGGAPGGVLRSANVYANDVHVGRHVGYIEPLEMELTPAAAAVESHRGPALGERCTGRLLCRRVRRDAWQRRIADSTAGVGRGLGDDVV
jgi:hypothetical protein